MQTSWLRPTTTIAVLAVVLACDSTPTSTTTSSTGRVLGDDVVGVLNHPLERLVDGRLELTLNGARLGSFSCDRGLFFSAAVTNMSAEPLELRAIQVQFATTEASCRDFVEPISPELSVTLGPGETRTVRRFDAAGQLCGMPEAVPGCAWRATAIVATAAGLVADEIGFATFRARLPCDGVVPRVLTPTEGAILTGRVNVTAGVAEGAGCNISARSIIEGFSARGDRVFRSSLLDLGDVFRWETSVLPEGQYWIDAYQNCCGIRSAPVVVTVRH
jgi:hypothetical protein